MIGEIEAVVATVGTIVNGTVLMPGCFDRFELAHISIWCHAVEQGDKPVGMGRLREEGSELVFRGRYDLHDPRGHFAHRVVTRLGRRALWSISFHGTRFEYGFLSDHLPGRRGHAQLFHEAWASEVSPVLVAADPVTRTLAIDGRPLSQARCQRPTYAESFP